MNALFVNDIQVVLATDGTWRRYWAVASRRRDALEIVAPLIPDGYRVTLTPLRLSLPEIMALKLEPMTAKELMFDPEIPS